MKTQENQPEQELSFKEWEQQMKGVTPPKKASFAPKEVEILIPKPAKKFKFPAKFFEHRKNVVDMDDAEKARMKEEFIKSYKKPLVQLEVPHCIMVDYKKKKKNELVVITLAKKLLAYVVQVSEKAPKKFRFTFTNRMQNYAIDVLEDLFRANQLRTDIKSTLEERKSLQKDAYTKLKLLSYISFIASENSCILEKQYLNIADYVHECLGWLHQWMQVGARL